MSRIKYIDNYPTCDDTHATLRIYFDEVSPDDITKLLRLKPSRTQVKGDRAKIKIKKKEKTSDRIVKLNGWFLETEDKVKSLDTRRHLDYILDKVSKKQKEIKGLINKGARVDITCFWVSKQGHGGPTLSLKQMRAITTLGIDISFDIYF